MTRKIYLASSWRNTFQPVMVQHLRVSGHEVYDFRNPAPGNKGFAWSAINPNWQDWDIDSYRAALTHPIAEAGFKLDKDALDWCDTCVLLLQSGRSAHLEAGYTMGQGKDTFVYCPENRTEPELMYLLGDGIFSNVNVLLQRLADAPRQPGNTGMVSDQTKALLVEVAELPNIHRSLMSHNERELIKLCTRLADRLAKENGLS